MTGLSDIEEDLASEDSDNCQASDQLLNSEGLHLAQDYHRDEDVQILERLIPETEPAGTSVYSFSEGGDFDMQQDLQNELLSMEGSPVSDHGYSQAMDVDEDDIEGWMWPDGNHNDGMMAESEDIEGTCCTTYNGPHCSYFSQMNCCFTSRSAFEFSGPTTGRRTDYYLCYSFNRAACGCSVSVNEPSTCTTPALTICILQSRL